MLVWRPFVKRRGEPHHNTHWDSSGHRSRAEMNGVNVGGGTFAAESGWSRYPIRRQGNGREHRPFTSVSLFCCWARFALLQNHFAVCLPSCKVGRSCVADLLPHRSCCVVETGCDWSRHEADEGLSRNLVAGSSKSKVYLCKTHELWCFIPDLIPFNPVPSPWHASQTVGPLT